MELLSIFPPIVKIYPIEKILKNIESDFIFFFFLHKFNILTKVGKESRKSCIKRHCSKNVFQSNRGAKRISHGNFNNQLVSILRSVNVLTCPVDMSFHASQIHIAD